MPPDYRSDKMDSREGKGVARKGWDAYVRAIDKHVTPKLLPYVVPTLEPLAREQVADLIGFWVLWHLYGGFDNLQEYGFHPSTIYRKVKRFRQIWGKHPDEFQFPGIVIDRDAYWGSELRKVGRPPKR
jgi:hypothetical protein